MDQSTTRVGTQKVNKYQKRQCSRVAGCCRGLHACTSLDRANHLEEKRRRRTSSPSLFLLQLFFAMQRQAIIKQQQKQPIVVHKTTRNKHRMGMHANVGFANLAKLIDEQWRTADPALKKEMNRSSRYGNGVYSQ